MSPSPTPFTGWSCITPSIEIAIRQRSGRAVPDTPVIRRTRRWNVTYAHAHSVITTKRLRKPINQKMWRKIQKSQAKNPETFSAEDVAHGGAAADRGHVAVVLVAERLQRLPGDRAQNVLRARASPCCIATCATPGSSVPSCVNAHRSPTTKISGCAATRERRLARDAAGAVERNAERLRERRRRHAGRPQHRCARRCRSASRLIVDAVARRSPSRPSPCALRRRAARATAAPPRAAFGKRGENVRRRPRRARCAPIPAGCGGSPGRSDWRAISASAPASSTPVGPPPTMTNVSSRRCAVGIAFRARPPRTRAASAAASRAHRRASSAPARAPPTRDGRSRRAPRRSRRSRDSRSADRIAVGDEHAACPRCRSRVRLGEQHLDVPLLPQNPADRRRDVAGRQRRRRHLIEQRLKQMVVVAIDERDAHRRAVERCARRSSPPKPPPTITTTIGIRSSTGRDCLRSEWRFGIGAVGSVIVEMLS